MAWARGWPRTAPTRCTCHKKRLVAGPPRRRRLHNGVRKVGPPLCRGGQKSPPLLPRPPLTRSRPCSPGGGPAFTSVGRLAVTQPCAAQVQPVSMSRPSYAIAASPESKCAETRRRTAYTVGFDIRLTTLYASGARGNLLIDVAFSKL